jgi:hypothetical protein
VANKKARRPYGLNIRKNLVINKEAPMVTSYKWAAGQYKQKDLLRDYLMTNDEGYEGAQMPLELKTW